MGQVFRELRNTPSYNDANAGAVARLARVIESERRERSPMLEVALEAIKT